MKPGFYGPFGNPQLRGHFLQLHLFVIAQNENLSVGLGKLPQSGSWLNSVKVVMGFLELAAALKFLRTAELRLLDTPQYFTYDLVLGIWVSLRNTQIY